MSVHKSPDHPSVYLEPEQGNGTQAEVLTISQQNEPQPAAHTEPAAKLAARLRHPSSLTPPGTQRRMSGGSLDARTWVGLCRGDVP
jgi:hypothetical protein